MARSSAAKGKEDAMPFSRRALAASALAAIGAEASRRAAAQTDAAADFPNRPIRMIVPYPPAGGNDLLARAIKAPLETRWSQPIVVENRPGANGTIATEAVAKGPADGYALLMGSTATHAINPALYRRLGYHPVRDFTPVAQVGSTPLILTAHPSVPAATVAEIIALAKARPGDLSFASVGNGSVGHLAGQLFQDAAGVEMLHVPYRGIAQASTELLAGLVKTAFSNVVNVLPFIREGNPRHRDYDRHAQPGAAGRADHRGDAAGLRRTALVGRFRAGPHARADRAEAERRHPRGPRRP
jgi:tripartite-type tricarboxylate transporter receptor subunit TctC